MSRIIRKSNTARIFNVSAIATALSLSGQLLQAAVSITPFGDATFVAAPTWRPVDFHFYAEAIDPNTFFLQSLPLILPQPDHVQASDGSIQPGTPHAPPYDHEISDGLAAAGITSRTRFTTEEFDGFNEVNGLLHGATFAFMIVAETQNAPVGLTPDGLFLADYPADPAAPLMFTLKDRHPGTRPLRGPGRHGTAIHRRPRAARPAPGCVHRAPRFAGLR